MRKTATNQLRDAPVDVKVVLSALWISMMLVFAYVDIFGFYRADVLKAALDGKVATTDFTVDQTFLTLTLVYVLLPSLMVVLSLLLRARINRIANLTVSVVYLVSVVASCIGETWTYYLVGSAVEVLLLAVIARTAWTWPSQSASRADGEPASAGAEQQREPAGVR